MHPPSNEGPSFAPPAPRPSGRPVTTAERLSEGAAGYGAGLMPVLGTAAGLLSRGGRMPGRAGMAMAAASQVLMLPAMFAGMNRMLEHNVTNQMRGYPLRDPSATGPDVEALAATPGVHTPSPRNPDGTPNLASRTAAVAGTAGMPRGTVGQGAHDPMSIMHTGFGNLWAHRIGDYFNHPATQNRLREPVTSDRANREVAGGEYGYWRRVNELDPSPGSRAGAAFDTEHRMRIQRGFTQGLPSGVAAILGGGQDPGDKV